MSGKVGGGVIINSEASLNHHYDTLKPDVVLDVKEMPEADLDASLIFVRDGVRTVVITQLTTDKAKYIINKWDSLFGTKKIVNLYFDPYNSVHGMDMILMKLLLDLGECCKKSNGITNAYGIIREGTYCRLN
jgi:hypothetical protein